MAVAMERYRHDRRASSPSSMATIYGLLDLVTELGTSGSASSASSSAGCSGFMIAWYLWVTAAASRARPADDPLR